MSEIYFDMWFRLKIWGLRCGGSCLIYLHKTERITFVPWVRRGELRLSAGCRALHPNEAWLSWAVGRNLMVLVSVLHPLQVLSEDEDSTGEVSEIIMLKILQ